MIYPDGSRKNQQTPDGAEPNANAPKVGSASSSASDSASPRLRVAIVVLAMQAVMAWWIADSEISRSVYLICYALMMPTVLYLLSARLLRSWLPLTPREMLLGYIVLTATLPLLGFGGLRFLVPGMGYLAHFSEGQPEWARYLPHLPQLPVLHDPEAVKGLYRGASRVPWQAWAVPIAFWSVYLLALCGIWIGLAALLHRIWIRQERLTFPIAQLPLELSDPRTDVVRLPVFWAGIAIPVVLQSLLALHDWYPVVPCFQLKALDVRPLLFTAPPWNAMPDVQIGFYPMAVGLAYFVPSEVTFSCLFFWLTSHLSYVGGAMSGLGGEGGGAARFPYPSEQGAGAWVAFAGLVVWGARFHWAGMVKSLAARERRDILILAAGAGVCALLCVGMMAATGVPLWLAGGILAFYVAYVLAGARVRAEAGGVWTVSPLNWTPFHAAHALAGPVTVPDAGLAGAAHFDLIHVDIRAATLPYLMEGLKIADASGLRWRTVLLWVAGGSVTALAFGWWHTLSTFYTLGAATSKSNDFALYRVQTVMREMHTLATTFPRWDIGGVNAFVFGAGLTLLLAALRLRFLTFPLHPVGYVLCNTFSMNHFFVPFLIAWLAKGFVQRVGGSKAYQRSLPFFVGLVLGDIVIQAVWAMIGSVFHVQVYSFLS